MAPLLTPQVNLVEMGVGGVGPGTPIEGIHPTQSLSTRYTSSTLLTCGLNISKTLWRLLGLSPTPTLMAALEHAPPHRRNDGAEEIIDVQRRPVYRVFAWIADILVSVRRAILGPD
ncbi:hypothetical protein Hypma_015065 [Hypsizygus marmoreus]|uniref:Uncharacterized protein n=1 Tax=Hypsizygus marmoreus TaxID=39966 RepID=A0A369KBP9_HYPMA|nr:hypothetical protein Hypma_015065 [Hypsizygus marmoreus]